ncbi:condensation domain-containing protein [Streptomyces sp. NPDC020681]|uniref:condensation domain-containing protein n=1 Tax=Streptomyces sp. NPDC020681 TaxID=3365083 RepID=UPI00379C9597
MQRAILARATFDEEGHPALHRYPPVHELIELHGPLDRELLAAAVRLATDDVDALRGRLRTCGSTVRWVPGPERPPVRLKEVDSGPPLMVAARSLRAPAYEPFHLQNDPAARFLLARTAPDHHLLLIALDHACADGRTLVLLIRRMLRWYSALCGGPGAAPGGFPSFLEFAGQFAAMARERSAAAEYWYRALRPAAEPGRRRPAFPGGRWQPLHDRFTELRTRHALSEQELRGVRETAAALGTDRHQLFLAATELVVSAWCESEDGSGAPRFVPLNYFRNGRHRRDWLNVPGPLAEPAVTVAPDSAHGEEPHGLGAWLAGFAAANAASPPFFGQALREFETPETEADRLVLFNFLPPLGRLRAEGLRVTPCSAELSDALEPDDARNRFGIYVRLLQDLEGPLVLHVDHDPRVLPDGGPFVAALLDVIALAGRRPEISTAEACRFVRAGWG